MRHPSQTIDTMSKHLCIYHGDHCNDGFGAAWTVWKHLGTEVDFHAARYGEDSPDVTGAHVLIVDFCYPSNVLDAMAARAEHITVIDHHKTARGHLERVTASNITTVFDDEHSGAMLTWQHFTSAEPPVLLRHIEDRDLMRLALPGTPQVHAALYSYPKTFAVWDHLMQTDVVGLIAEGEAILRKHHSDIEAHVSTSAHTILLAGYTVPAINCPAAWATDACALINESGTPFAVAYYYAGTHWRYSLRSTRDGLDVAEIAEQFGGGGHRHAAGFTSCDPVHVLVG
jgi:hypothetical protein